MLRSWWTWASCCVTRVTRLSLWGSCWIVVVVVLWIKIHVRIHPRWLLGRSGRHGGISILRIAMLWSTFAMCTATTFCAGLSRWQARARTCGALLKYVQLSSSNIWPTSSGKQWLFKPRLFVSGSNDMCGCAPSSPPTSIFGIHLRGPDH